MVETNVKLYIACSSVLYLKFLLVTFIQGPKAFKSGSRPPEDILLPMAEGREQNYGLAETKDKAVFKAREEVHRWQRIIANDLESIPFALFIFGGGILAGNNDVVHAGALIVRIDPTAARHRVDGHGAGMHRGVAAGQDAAAEDEERERDGLEVVAHDARPAVLGLARLEHLLVVRLVQAVGLLAALADGLGQAQAGVLGRAAARAELLAALHARGQQELEVQHGRAGDVDRDVALDHGGRRRPGPLTKLRRLQRREA
ncbi:hypothetical protein ON010_g10586 [Phytophthora cinnamomi]|nr:hypothetical protein ON010_g10586 [Phytophthora cinnamomi]